VVHAVSDARAALAAVRRALEQSDEPSQLAHDVLAALSLAVAAERAFAEAKQKKDSLDRSVSRCAYSYSSVVMRVCVCVVRYSWCCVCMLNQRTALGTSVLTISRTSNIVQYQQQSQHWYCLAIVQRVYSRSACSVTVAAQVLTHG
jgi:hypothetical protein